MANIYDQFDEPQAETNVYDQFDLVAAEPNIYDQFDTVSPTLKPSLTSPPGEAVPFKFERTRVSTPAETFSAMGEGISGVAGAFAQDLVPSLARIPASIGGIVQLAEETTIPALLGASTGGVGKQVRDFWNDLADDLESEKKTTAQKYAGMTAQSVAPNIVFLTAGALAKKSPVAVAGMAMQVFGDKYPKMREAGYGVLESVAISGGYMMAEAVGEWFSAKALLDPALDLGKRLVRTAITEMLGEQATEAIQASIDKITIDKNMTWGDYFDRVKDTAIVTAAAIPILGGAGHVVTKGVQALEKPVDEGTAPSEIAQTAPIPEPITQPEKAVDIIQLTKEIKSEEEKALQERAKRDKDVSQILYEVGNEGVQIGQKEIGQTKEVVSKEVKTYEGGVLAPIDKIPELKKEGKRKELFRKPAVTPVRDGTDVPVLVNSKDIYVDPARLQFKKGVDPTTGEQEALGGKWDAKAGGIVTLFRDEQGKLWAVNGHHRVALAKRLGDKDMNAFILESSDGHTFETARKVGAELNIMEGQGDIYDHAEFFRQEQGITADKAGSRKLQKSAFAIGRHLEDRAYTSFVARQITEGQAYGIAKGAANNASIQDTALHYLTRNPRATELETENFARLVAKSNVPKQGTGQTDIFQSGENLAWLQKMEAMTKTGSKIMKDIDKDIAAMGSGRNIDRAERAKKGGIYADVGKANARIVSLKKQKVKWSGWQNDPKLFAQVEREAGYEPEVKKREEPKREAQVVETPKKPEPPKEMRTDLDNPNQGMLLNVQPEMPKTGKTTTKKQAKSLGSLFDQPDKKQTKMESESTSEIKMLGSTDRISKDRMPKIAPDGTYEGKIEDWFQETDEAIFKNGVEAKKLKKLIKESIGKQPHVTRSVKRSKFDDKAKRIDEAIQLYIDLKPTKTDPNRTQRLLAKYKKALSKEQLKIIDRAMEIENNPELKKVADDIIALDKAMGLKAMSADVITNVLENHLTRHWKPLKKKARAESMRKFGTTTGLSKRRTFESVLEGWSLGRELAIKGATNSLLETKNIISTTIENKTLIKELLGLKDTDGKKMLSTHDREGYVQIEHPSFTAWEYGGKIDTEAIVETMRKVSDLVQSQKTKKTVMRGDIEESKPITALKKMTIDSLMGRGFTEAESNNVIERLQQSASKGNGSSIETVIDNVIEKIKTIETSEKVKGVKLSPHLSRDTIVTEDGTILKRKVLYAPEEIAKDLNAIFSDSKLKGVPAIDVITKYNAVMKAWILQTSLFHHQAFIRSYWFGTTGKTFKEWNIRQAYKDGLKAAEDMDKDLILLVRNGLTLGNMQDWEESILREEDTIFGETIDKIGGIPRDVKDKLNALREAQADFLFKELGAGLKAKAALIEHRNLLKKHPDMDANERAAIVAKLINADFGGLHLKRARRNQTVQHIFRLFFLAPDWTESNVRTMIGIFKGGSKKKTQFSRNFRGSSDAQVAFYRKFWASVITKGITGSILLNLALSLGDDEDAIERFKIAWKAGYYKWLDVDITPLARLLGDTNGRRKYFSIFGHFKDPMKFVTHPVRSVHHKESILYRTIHEGVVGTNWQGRKFTTLTELFGLDGKGKQKGKLTKWGPGSPVEYKQMPSYLLSQLRNTQPVQLQALISYQLGEMGGFLAIMRSMGLAVSEGPKNKPQQRRR